MKKYILQFATIISVGVLLIANEGCRKLEDFGDTNLNPNGVAEPNTGALMSNVAANIAGTVTTQAPSMFCQYLAESTYPGTSKYAALQADASPTYSGILMDCQVIIDKNLDPDFAPKASANGDNGSQIAIATILKSYILWTVTDRWGDVPYSEALRGAGALLPKYDEQQDIYEGLINDITAANDMFNPNGGPLPGDKYMYAGDISKWRKFGNSLKMLMALRLSKRFPAAGGYAAEKFNEALNSPYGYMTDNADNFIVDYPGGNFRNPFWSLHVSQDIAVSLTFTDVLTGLTNDPRRDAMASTQTGCPFGLVGAAPIGVPYARTFNPPFSDEGAPLVIINAASILLAKAEAIERGWVPGMTTADAKVAYDQAITVSFEQWGKTVPAPYLTTGPANYLTGTGVLTIGGASVVGSSAVTATPIERINLQQYIAFYPGGVQGWSNWRRTGVPNLQPTIFSVNNSGEIPRRIPYGVQDYNTNAVQLNIAIARLPGGDTQDEYVWWDRP